MWHVGGQYLNSRMLLGTALFPSPQAMADAFRSSQAGVATVSLRRQMPDATKDNGNDFWHLVKGLDVRILPNTAGCRTAKEAITVAQMARELFETNWIKLEVIGDDYTLQPDVYALLEAAKTLIADGFEVFPYTTADLIVAQRLVAAGCKIVMPWASPIGSGQGINDPRALETLRKRLPEVTLIVDAGIGKPSDAAKVMEMGFDGVLLNSAVALAQDPVDMARAFGLAIEAGSVAYRAGLMQARAMATPSTPVAGTPFWHQVKTNDSSIKIPNTTASLVVFEQEEVKELSKPIVWTIAGSDSGGGAGIQADLLTINNLGAYACSVITVLTAQNTKGVASIEPVNIGMLKAQLDALYSDLKPSVVKLGVLYDAENIKTVTNFLKTTAAKVVCDPVLVATSGDSLTKKEAAKFLVSHLIPHVDVLTPNIPEAHALLQEDMQKFHTIVKDEKLLQEYMEELAAKLLKLGAKAVLLKGGHAASNFSQDFWTNGHEKAWLTSPMLPVKNTHGTGCTLSSALASALALNYTELDAVIIAKAYVNQGLRLGEAMGAGSMPLYHGGWPENPADIPWLTQDLASGRRRPTFPDCGKEPLGLYPLVNRAEWLNRLIPLGVSTVQLRIKDLEGEALEAEIKKAIAIAREAKHQCRLFINDYWQLAIKYDAYGVHLGQEDLDTADFSAIANSGIRLGISTHSYTELARTLAYQPSYIGFGPVYETTSKVLKFAPQGLELLSRWRKMVTCPLIAIGGITLERAPAVLQTGVDGIAIIKDLADAPDVPAHVGKWLKLFGSKRSAEYSGISSEIAGEIPAATSR